MGSSLEPSSPATRRVDLEAAAERRHTVAQAAQSRTRRRVGAADTVVGDLDQDLPAVAAHVDSRVLARAYLAMLVSASATTK